MAKSFGDEVNRLLRETARGLIEDRFDGNQRQFADAVGVSAAFISDFLTEKRGAGLDLLVGVSKYAPLVVMEILEIDIPNVLRSAAHGGTQEEELMATLPPATVRALRAAIELTGASVNEALEAAAAAFKAHGDVPGADPDWWLVKIRERMSARSNPSSRPPANPLTVKPS